MAPDSGLLHLLHLLGAASFARGCCCQGLLGTIVLKIYSGCVPQMYIQINQEEYDCMLYQDVLKKVLHVISRCVEEGIACYIKMC